MPNCKSFHVTEAERKHVRRCVPFQQQDMRAVIKFFFPPLQRKAPKEIHAILTETLGEHAPSYATIKNWVDQFKRGDFPPVYRVHFISAIIIQHSISCTLQVTSGVHIISIRFCRVINTVIITYIIRQYHCMNTLGILCITSVYAIHNSRQKLTPR